MFWRVITTMSFVLLVAMVLVQPTQAQQRAPQEADEQSANGGVTLVADVSMEKEYATYVDGVLTVAFTITNNENDRAQAGVHYRVIAQSSDATDITKEVVDNQSYDDVFTLAPGQTVHKVLTYNQPPHLSGPYDIVVKAFTTRGLPLATMKLGRLDFVALQKDGYVLRHCTVSPKENPQYVYDAILGMDIAQDETLMVECEITPVPQEDVRKQLQVHAKTFLRLLGGESVSETSSIPYEIVDGKDGKLIRFALPTAQKPQAYSATVNIVNQDNTVVSNTIEVHYVLKGASATLNNATLDKTAYKAGDVAHVKVLFSKSADLFPNARGFLGQDENKVLEQINQSAQQQAVDFVVTIKDAQGTACADPVKVDHTDIRSSDLNIDVPITATCNGPQLDITASDPSGTVYDHMAYDFSSATDATVDQNTRQQKDNVSPLSGKMILGLFIAGLFIIALILIATKRKKTTAHLSMFFLLTFAGSAMLVATSAEAKTYTYCIENWTCGWHVIAEITTTQCPTTADIDLFVGSCQNSHSPYVGQLYMGGDKVGQTATSCDIGTDNHGVYGWRCYIEGEESFTYDKLDQNPGKHNIGIKLRWGHYSKISDYEKGIGTGFKATDPDYTDTYTYTTKACPVKGVCGKSNGKQFSNPPTSRLCSAGTASIVNGSGINWTWTCSGASGGTSARCSATKPPMNGVCGSAINKTYASAGELNRDELCKSGTPQPRIQSGNGPWSWMCRGINGGRNSGKCTARQKEPKCGTDVGKTMAAKPTNLCAPGTVSKVAYQYNSAEKKGTWTWNCELGGKTSEQCSATRGCTDPNALICNNTCMPPVTFSSQVNLRRGGGADPAKINIPDGVWCSIEGGKEILGPETIELSVTSHPLRLGPNDKEVLCGCKGTTSRPPGGGGDKCADGTKISAGKACKYDDPRALDGTIQCVCTAKKCSQAGTCVATPVFANSYSSSVCASNCSSNADCSSGSIRETN